MQTMLCVGAVVFFGSVTLVSTLKIWNAYAGKGFDVQYVEGDKRTWKYVTAESFSLDDATLTAIFYDQSGMQCGKAYNVFL